MKFKCPNCKDTRLEEVIVNVTVVSEICDIGEGGDIFYGEQSNEGGEVERYQCMGCGFVIPNEDNEPVRDCVGLYEWLAGEKE